MLVAHTHCEAIRFFTLKVTQWLLQYQGLTVLAMPYVKSYSKRTASVKYSKSSAADAPFLPVALSGLLLFPPEQI